MRKIVILFALSIAYAAVRYVVFMPQNLPNMPVFVINKGVSMAAAFCFAIAFWQQRRQMRAAHSDLAAGRAPAAWFRAGVFGAIWHIPMSLAILRPSYFKEFFAGTDDGRMSFSGETVFLFGGMTAAGAYLLTRTHWTPLQRWWMSLAMMTTLFSHTLCMGIARGMNITASHAYLPPMWLLSLIGTGLGIAFLAVSKPRSRNLLAENQTQDPNAPSNG